MIKFQTRYHNNLKRVAHALAECTHRIIINIMKLHIFHILARFK